MGTGAVSESELSELDNIQDTPDRYTFTELLALLGHVDDHHRDQVAVCWQKPGGTFTPDLQTTEDAPRFVDQLLTYRDGNTDVWFGINPVSRTVTRGRGTAKDVVRLAALYADVDIKPGACPDMQTARDVIADLSAILGQRPCAVTHSGHGLQPIWVVDRESSEKLTNPEAQKLSRRFGRLVADIAKRRRVALDNVSDLARVLRVPGTKNVKDPENPVPAWCEADTGTVLTVEDIAQALDDHGLIELQSDAAYTGAVISAPDGWQYGSTDCSYVNAMVRQWDQKSDKPKNGRHQWAMYKAVRLAAAHRLGCLTEHGLQVALDRLERSLEHWCNTVGEPRDVQPDEVEGAYRWAMEKVSTFTDERTSTELGGHAHQSPGVEPAAPVESSQPLYTDVAALLAGGLPDPPRPEVLQRTDGAPLFYRGEINVLFGDPEHGKTWVGLAACAEVLATGGRVLVADLDHNGASAIISRLVLLGAPVATLCDPERFRHCEPGEIAEVKQMVTDSAGWQPELILVDSTGELLPMFDASSDSGDDFTRVHNRVLQPLAATGAAVVLVDHLAKNRESRDIGPGGTMAKRRTVGGVSLRVVRERPYTKSDGGASRLLINKDRHGGVRDHCPAPRPGREREEQVAGMFILDAADGGVAQWRITAPGAEIGTADQPFRPTVLMERASRFIEEHPGEFTRNKIGEEVTGKKQMVLMAVDLLVAEEYVSRPDGSRAHYTSVRPYRQSGDPASDQHTGLGDRLRRHADTADGKGQSDG